MRADDFWVDEDGGQQLNVPLLQDFRRAPTTQFSDLEAAIALARLLHEQFQRYGTDSTQEISGAESREAMRTLVALADRLGLAFSPPFRDLSGFRAYWGSHGGYGSWAARRGMLQELFDPVHEELERLEEDALRGELAESISPSQATGWPAVDLEIAELRRHFHSARTPQDYRNIGNDVVAVLEALSAAAYDRSRHLFEGETEPPVAQTKNRLARIIDVDSEFEGSDELVRLARSTADMAQAVKHNSAGSAVRAGIAADAVIQLANIIRRLQSSEPPE
jgi:hypothetical protein